MQITLLTHNLNIKFRISTQTNTKMKYHILIIENSSFNVDFKKLSREDGAVNLEV